MNRRAVDGLVVVEIEHRVRRHILRVGFRARANDARRSEISRPCGKCHTKSIPGYAVLISVQMMAIAVQRLR